MLQMENLAKRFKDFIAERTNHERLVEMKSIKLLNGTKLSVNFSTNGVSLM